MPAIGVLIKPSSGMCNMHCDYCFYCDEAQKRVQESYGFMSEATLKNIVRKTMLKAEHSVSYAFQGGEPTLRGLDFYRYLMELEKKYNKNGIQVHNALQTNGYFIDEQWCRFLKENHFLVGVSLDGIKETHDAYRHDKKGGPTYARIYKNIQLMQKMGVDFNILTVVNQKIAGNIEQIYRHYKQEGWMYQQYIACLDPLEETRGQNEYALHPEQYGNFLIRLFELWYEDWKKGEQPYIRQFDNYIGILLGYQPEACDMCGKCGIQNVVEADGGVYPCDFYMLDEYRLGSFNENQIEEINQKRMEIGFVERSLKLSEKCRDCKYFSLCRGGCQRHRDFDPVTDSYTNYFCESYRMFFDACLDRMKEAAKGSRL